MSAASGKKPRLDKSKTLGQTMVEFAMTIPLLVLLLFAIIQYGFIFSAFMTLRHGAHVTARTLSLNNANLNNPKPIACQAITPLLDCARLNNPTVSTVVVAGENARRVQLTYTLPLIVRFVVPGAVGNTMLITAEAIYRIN